MAIWSNKFHQAMNTSAYDFNQSIQVDARLLDADLRGSIGHAKMLGNQEVLTPIEADQLCQTLQVMREEYAAGKLVIDYGCEDIHSFIEEELTKRLGAIGKKIHTGRSRNDQVATAMKIYAKDAAQSLQEGLKKAVLTFCDQAEVYKETIMPGYTHLQRAQPITYGHYLMAYVEMFRRDYGRLGDVIKRIDQTLPLGAGALATTTFPLDRFQTAEFLGFESPSLNSLDAVADRDYSLEFLSALAVMAMHLSRYAEETILWASQEFHFVHIEDTFSTGSSIMPQKKNADIHELMRGKTGRVYGDLMAVLTLMKGLPLTYNKDLQEEKERLFDAIDTMTMMVSLLPEMLKATQPDTEAMYKAAGKGFLNATDCADYLTAKGIPFREAYQTTGDLLQYCQSHQKTLETLTLEEYQQFDPHFDEGIYQAIDLKTCVYKRQVLGGPAPQCVADHIQRVRAFFLDDKKVN